MTVSIDRQVTEFVGTNNENSPDQDLIEKTLTGLQVVLDRERAHLNSNRTDLLESFAREKLQILANLDRASRDNSRPAKFNKEALVKLSNALKENTAALKFRMDAIGEISTSIKDAMVHAESDGTYEARGSVNGIRRW